MKHARRGVKYARSGVKYARKEENARKAARRPVRPRRSAPVSGAQGAPREAETGGGVGRAAAAWLGASTPQDGPAALALAVLVVVSYFPALQGGFVWDDVIFAEEPVIQSPGALRSIWFAPADIKNEGHYWPLVYTSFWLEHKLWGLQPAGYHAVNIFLHLLNCLLLWRLLLRLAVPGALLIAAVFAVHPLHVESVAWIIERKDVLSGLFYLSAVLAWLRFVEVERVGHYLLLALLFAAGLLSKSVVVTLPLALLIVQWWRSGRVTRLDLLRVAPLIVLGAVVAAADLAFYRGREVLDLGYTLAERMLIAGRALWFYAGKLVWPVELAVIYPLWELDARSPAGWGYVVAAAGLALALWLGRERLGRGPLAGALYFALTLGPVLGFVDYGYMQFSFVADRFQYLAGIGVLAVLLGAAAHAVGVCRIGAPAADPTGLRTVGGAGPKAAPRGEGFGALGRLPAGEPAVAGERGPAGMRASADERSAARSAAAPAAAGWRGVRYGAWVVAAVVVLLLGSLTWRQAGIYRDEVTLFSHVVAHNPEARDAHLNLGNALLEADRTEEGLAASRIAVEQRPESADAYSNLGLALMNLERFTEAEESLRRALQLDSRHKSALQNIAELLRKQGQYEAAVAAYQNVLERDRRYALAYAGMGDALFNLRRYEEALASVMQALVLQPRLPMAGALEVLMGRAARELGRLDAAEEHFLRAMQLDPDDAAPVLDLAGVRGQQQRGAEADALLRRARELRPHDPATLQNVAEALRKQDRYEEALPAYRAVLEVDAEYALAYAGMGDTLFRLERYAEAMEALARAATLQPDLPMAGSLHRLMGRAAQELGRADAADHFERAVQLDPRDADALDRLAMLRFGEQDYEAAFRLYGSLLEINPDNAQTHSNLGATLYYLGRSEEALQSFERALALAPELETARTGRDRLRQTMRQEAP